MDGGMRKHLRALFYDIEWDDFTAVYDDGSVRHLAHNGSLDEAAQDYRLWLMRARKAVEDAKEQPRPGMAA